MEFLQIVILTSVSFVVLFILAKIMGYRQLSEMSFFDYVIGITIGSIAAEMSTNIDIEWWKGISAMVIYAVFDIILEYLSQKSIKARKLITGTPIILVQKGTIIKKNLKKAKIELDDLLTSARVNGYFNLADIDYAIMETNGQISFLPTPLKRTLNPKDFNFAPEREGLCVNVVLDGNIMQDNLTNANITETKLRKILGGRGKKVEEILLATINEAGQIDIFDKQKQS